jgi:hypothetical protein
MSEDPHIKSGRYHGEMLGEPQRLEFNPSGRNRCGLRIYLPIA